MKGRRKNLSLSKETHIVCTPSPQLLAEEPARERSENIDANIFASDDRQTKKAAPVWISCVCSPKDAAGACVICGKDISELSTEEQERHVNECVDNRAGASEVRCMICDVDLSHVEENERAKHVNDCCDMMIQENNLSKACSSDVAGGLCCHVEEDFKEEQKAASDFKEEDVNPSMTVQEALEALGLNKFLVNFAGCDRALVSLEEEEMRTRGLTVGARKKLLGLKRHVEMRASETARRRKRLTYVGQMERGEASKRGAAQLTLQLKNMNEGNALQQQQGCSQLQLALALSASLQSCESEVESDLRAKRGLAASLQEACEACEGNEDEVSTLLLLFSSTCCRPPPSSLPALPPASGWEGKRTTSGACRSLWRRAAADLDDLQDSDKFLTERLILMRNSRQERGEEEKEREEGEGRGRGETGREESLLVEGSPSMRLGAADQFDDQEESFEQLLQLIVDDDGSSQEFPCGEGTWVEETDGRGAEEEGEKQSSGIEQMVDLIRCKLMTLSPHARSSIQEEVIRRVSEQIDSYDRARSLIKVRTEMEIARLTRRMEKEIDREDRRHAARLRESVCSCLQLFE